MGTLSPTPQRALLRAVFARCGGGMRALGGGLLLPGCGASQGWALTRARRLVLPTCGRGLLPTGCWCGGRGRGNPSPTPQRAQLRAGFARCKGSTRAPWGGLSLASVWGVRGWALSHAQPPVVGECGRGPLPTRCGCGVRPWRPVPRFVLFCARFPDWRQPLAVVFWHLSLCRGCCRLRASLACLVAPRWCAAPRPVWSLPVLQLAFQVPWCLAPSSGLSPPALLGGCAGHVEAGREPGPLCLPLAPTEAGALGSLRVVLGQGSVMGLSPAVPSGFPVGLRALRLLVVCGPGH